VKRAASVRCLPRNIGRRNFLSDDTACHVGTFALVPQIADAVRVPVIVAGAIADGRRIVASFALGADAVQIGTAYLLCPEARQRNRLARRFYQSLGRPGGAPGTRHARRALTRPMAAQALEQLLSRSGAD